QLRALSPPPNPVPQPPPCPAPLSTRLPESPPAAGGLSKDAVAQHYMTHATHRQWCLHSRVGPGTLLNSWVGRPPAPPPYRVDSRPVVSVLLGEERMAWRSGTTRARAREFLYRRAGRWRRRFLRRALKAPAARYVLRPPS